MVDYSTSDVPEVLLSKAGGPFKMEELSLMALLECPLCSELLDASAKVLPCQHTFCISCLQRQEATHSQLLCPECGAPVPARTVEELPENYLLVRLLGGLNGLEGQNRTAQRARYSVPLARGSVRVEGDQQQGSHHREKQGHSEVSAWPSPVLCFSGIPSLVLNCLFVLLSFKVTCSLKIWSIEFIKRSKS